MIAKNATAKINLCRDSFLNKKNLYKYDIWSDVIILVKHDTPVQVLNELITDKSIIFSDNYQELLDMKEGRLLLPSDDIVKKEFFITKDEYEKNKLLERYFNNEIDEIIIIETSECKQYISTEKNECSIEVFFSAVYDKNQAFMIYQKPSK